MGIASQGVAVSSGSNLAIAGVKPSGVAIQGNTVWIAPTVVMPWQLLASVVAMGPIVTTAPIDTTGATLLVIISINRGATGSYFSDSQNNSWGLGIQALNPSFNAGSSIFYSLNPTTSTAHTFTGNQVAYSGLIVLAYKGPSSIADQTSSMVNASGGPGGGNLQLSSLTPSANNSLVIAGLTHFFNSVPTIDSGFSIAANQPYSPNMGGTAAMLLQNSIASLAPTWTIGATLYAGMASTMMNFIPSP